MSAAADKERVLKETFEVLVIAFVVSVLVVAAGAFAVMIAVGMWHVYNPAVPALGYVDCVYGVAVTGLLASVTVPVTRR